jgi:hypothetical protein
MRPALSIPRSMSLPQRIHVSLQPAALAQFEIGKDYYVDFVLALNPAS